MSGARAGQVHGPSSWAQQCPAMAGAAWARSKLRALELQWDGAKAGGVCTQLWGCLGAALSVRNFWRLESNSEICMPKCQYSGSSVVLYLS